jgi:hypothetical protein
MRLSFTKKAMMMGMYIGPAVVGIIAGAAIMYFLFFKGILPCPVVPVAGG